MPGKSEPFTPSSILFRPQWLPPEGRWWRRRVLPPGPLHLLYAALYHHSLGRTLGTADIGIGELNEKAAFHSPQYGPISAMLC